MCRTNRRGACRDERRQGLLDFLGARGQPGERGTPHAPSLDISRAADAHAWSPPHDAPARSPFLLYSRGGGATSRRRARTPSWRGSTRRSSCAACSRRPRTKVRCPPKALRTVPSRRFFERISRHVGHTAEQQQRAELMWSSRVTTRSTVLSCPPSSHPTPRHPRGATPRHPSRRHPTPPSRRLVLRLAQRT